MNQVKPIQILFITIITMVLAYYFNILLHEWGHGTVAWIFGQKSSPFDVQYGGWALLHVDENVNYDQLLAQGKGIIAALIGLGGFMVTVVLIICDLLLMRMKSVQKRPFVFSFLYWSLILNMVPVYQYIPVTTFAVEGDIGRAIHGFNISPLWVLLLGTPLVIAALLRILVIEIPKAYRVLFIHNIFWQRVFLLVSLSVIFLLIYTHGYNPITDPTNPLPSKIMAGVSVLFVPILFFVFNPSNSWVKKSLLKQ